MNNRCEEDAIESALVDSPVGKLPSFLKLQKEYAFWDGLLGRAYIATSNEYWLVDQLVDCLVDQLVDCLVSWLEGPVRELNFSSKWISHQIT